MILVTFVPPSNEFYAECNIQGKYHLVIDLYNRADKTKINVKTLNRRDFPEIEKWMTDARKSYLNFLGALSQAQIQKNKTVRDFKLFDFPIYWLTAISEKQPRNHWLFSFFIFLEFLNSNWYDNNEKIIVYLNAQTSYLKDVILKSKNSNRIKCETHFKISSKINLFVEIIKIHFRAFILRLPKYTNNRDENQPIQIISNSTTSFLYSQFLDFSVTQKYPIAYKPMCLSVINKQNINFISKYFWKYKPGIFTKLKILIQSLKLFYIISNLKENIQINNITFPVEIIKFEFFEVLKKTQLYFIKYIWYKSYFSSLENKTLFFLEDEFYIAGRIVSKAFKDAHNKNIQLLGLQHGMFSYSHTVYAILQNEIDVIKNGDCIPLPQKFIVWSDYFKEIFKSYNNLGEEFIEVFGSPNFISLKNRIKNKYFDTINSEYILWCTTGEEQFVYEVPFILKLIEIYQLPLVIRLHPVGHINPKFVEERLKNTFFKIDNEKDIYNSILKSKLVVTSAHSTVVLDCVVCNKPVYRIIFDRDDVFENNDKIINVKYIEQLENIEYNECSNLDDSNSYLYLNDDRWQNFINRELADNV